MLKPWTNRFIYLGLLIFIGGTLFSCATFRHDVSFIQPKLPYLGTKNYKDRPLVAVSGFSNKSAYSADKLWDTSAQMLNTALVNSGSFRVVEWKRMKDLVDWKILSTATLVDSPPDREKVRKILLCEYFVGGSIISFDVRQFSEVSALSKSKTYKTTIRVDLWMQDARSGEYVGASSAEVTGKQVYEGGVTGGQTGTWDPNVANQTLERAISIAVQKIIISQDSSKSNKP